jgi:hypothetical protein
MSKKFDFDKFDAHCASILDNLFGEDDGAAVPSPSEIRSNGFGDEHLMVQDPRPIYTCEQEFEPAQVVYEDPILQRLYDQLSSIFEDGASVSDWYDEDEDKQSMLEQLSAEHDLVNNLIEARITELNNS